ncbi:hypothetical protein PPYR_10798 [Photinus pyralis]|uniref:MARVEL domain-containing protein n=1 Tax=Photinus pyralis TaxID=7054 RepID=A0A5N4AHE2_PHOPY|nr:hypothetical protein PPYR_10798 [Photinus pyralis]
MPKTLIALFKELGFLLKIIELVFCVINCVLISRCAISWCFRKGLLEMNIACAYGYTLVLVAIIMAYAFDEPHRSTEKAFLLVGCVLSMITGIFTLVQFKTRVKLTEVCHQADIVMVGICTIVGGGFMLIDYLRQLQW